MATTNSQDNEIFVGRDPELLTLAEVFADAIAHKRTRVVFVQGDYGAGKSALVREFLRRTERQYDTVLIGRGTFEMEKDSGGYGQFGKALSDIFERANTLSATKGNLAELAMKIAPAWLGLIPVVGGVIGATVATLDGVNSISRSSQKYTADLIGYQFTNALKELSAKRPVILFLDDLQWADESSLALFNRIGNTDIDHPLLIIVAYRPVEALETGAFAETFRDIRANLLERRDAVEVVLEEGIDENGIDVRQYIQRRYVTNMFPDELASKVQAHTRGHALFVTQIFSWWEEQGMITQESSSGETWWRMSTGIDLNAPLPKKVGEIIDARIRRLSDEMQDILRCASVQGESFSSQIAGKILELGERTLARDMSILENTYRLVEYEKQTEVGSILIDLYQFLHPYFGERIRQQLNQQERYLLHRQIGECLEQIHGPNTAPVAGQLARHFSVAGMRARALQYTVQAARYELARSSWQEAKRWSDEGLAMLGKRADSSNAGESRLDLLECMAEACYWSGSFKDAEHYYHEALIQAGALDIAPERLLILYGRLAWSHTDWAEGLRIALQGLELVNKGDIPLSETQLDFMCILGKQYWATDDTENALRVLKATLADAEKLDPTPGVLRIKADVLRKLGHIAFQHDGQYRLSVEYYERSIEIGRRIDNDSIAGQALVDLADVLIWMGRYDEAENAICQGRRIAERHGDRSIETDGLNSLGKVRYWQKEYHAAIDLYQQAIRQALEIGYIWYLSYYYAGLAEAYLALGLIDQSREAIVQSLASTEDNEWVVAYARSIVGRINACDKQYHEAEDAFCGSLEYYDRTVCPWDQATTRMHYARMLADEGESERARTLSDVAKEIFLKLELDHMVSEVDALLAKLE